MHDSYTIYINLDGFGKYYYDEIKDKNKHIPNIMKLIEEGIFFNNAYTGIPSITFPMQSSIVSGCYSNGTGNCYKYFDKDSLQIIYNKRKNNAETIGEVLKQHERPFVSIQQFALEGKGCTRDDPNYLYIEPSGNYKKRFDILENLITHHQIVDGDNIYQYEELPAYMFLYIDDLDTIGHNKDRALTEKRRVRNVIQRIKDIDICIGDLVNLLKCKNIYEKTNILITTDHGMLSFRGKSKMKTLKKTLYKMGYEHVYITKSGGVPENYDVLLTSHDIQCQVYFKDKNINLGEIKKVLSREKYVDTILTRNELKEKGTWMGYGDLVISPVEGEHFNHKNNYFIIPRATHDSLHIKCQQIFTILKGPSFWDGLKYDKKVHNIDFIPTICHVTGLPIMKNATGEILHSVIK